VLARTVFPLVAGLPPIDMRSDDEHTLPKRIDPCDIDALDPAVPRTSSATTLGSPETGADPAFCRRSAPRAVLSWAEDSASEELQ